MAPKPYIFIYIYINTLYFTQCCFQAVNRPSGPDFSRTAPGTPPKAAPRPADGLREGRFRCFPGSSLAKIRPGRPIYGPEALLRNTEYTPPMPQRQARGYRFGGRFPRPRFRRASGPPSRRQVGTTYLLNGQRHLANRSSEAVLH